MIKSRTKKYYYLSFNQLNSLIDLLIKTIDRLELIYVAKKNKTILKEIAKQKKALAEAYRIRRKKFKK